MEVNRSHASVQSNESRYVRLQFALKMRFHPRFWSIMQALADLLQFWITRRRNALILHQLLLTPVTSYIKLPRPGESVAAFPAGWGR